ncbi:uncharacterized protein G2W53_012186 [Senna tora]|uniref:Uncharacterized protein n=1 Tax=Senna tora TaxID=362788 RepID=A0A834TWN1_9FABA|nr:uncharacterized protein G2W53_012186 [Senna tora]
MGCWAVDMMALIPVEEEISLLEWHAPCFGNAYYDPCHA